MKIFQHRAKMRLLYLHRACYLNTGCTLDISTLFVPLFLPFFYLSRPSLPRFHIYLRCSIQYVYFIACLYLFASVYRLRFSLFFYCGNEGRSQE